MALTQLTFVVETEVAAEQLRDQVAQILGEYGDVVEVQEASPKPWFRVVAVDTDRRKADTPKRVESYVQADSPEEAIAAVGTAAVLPTDAVPMPGGPPPGHNSGGQ